MRIDAAINRSRGNRALIEENKADLKVTAVSLPIERTAAIGDVGKLLPKRLAHCVEWQRNETGKLNGVVQLAEKLLGVDARAGLLTPEMNVVAHAIRVVRPNR